MIPKSYIMHFRADSMEDMERLNLLCSILREKGTCFSITDILLRGKKGYEVFWYINRENKRTRFGNPDGRYN